MTFDEIRPFVRNVTKFIWIWENETFSIPYDCRIFAITDGEAQLRTKDSSFTLRRGAFVFFNAAEPYWFTNTSDSPFRFICVNLDLTQSHRDIDIFVQPGLPDNFDSSKIVERTEIPELLHSIIIPDECGLSERVNEIFNEYQNGAKFSDIRLTALTTDVLINAVRLSEDSSPRHSQVIAAAKSYVHEHYGESITNVDIAASIGYHPYYLSRLFAECEGKSLHRYLNEFRLRSAMHLLSISTQTIEQIACVCGFSSPAHFASSFRKEFGRLPSEFRREK